MRRSICLAYALPPHVQWKSVAHSLTLLLSAPNGWPQYMEEFPMKILLATAALATLVSSSAHAQYGVWRGDYRAYAQVPQYAAYRSYGSSSAYAQVPRAAYRSYGSSRAYAQVPPYAAYRSYGFNGAYAQLPPYAAYRAYAQVPPYATYRAYAQVPTPGFY